MRHMKRNILLSVLTGVTLTGLSYIMGNISYPMLGEKDVLHKLETFKQLVGIHSRGIPDEVLLVNVAYDKALIDFSQEGRYIGQRTITDRHKLLRFLEKAKAANNYRYIMLDVLFARGMTTDVDSALFHTIVSMPRLSIATHSNVQLQDTVLLRKAARADYSITTEETSFVRYQFLQDGESSIPLAMYRELDGGNISQHGLLYSSHGRLCTNAVTLKLPIRVEGEYRSNEAMADCNFIHLGADLLDMDTIVSVAEQMENKIIVIGDFTDDTHTTYAGDMPGSLICLNAYYALKHGDHLVCLPFIILMTLIYILLTSVLLSGWTPIRLMNSKWLRILIVFVSYAALFFVIALLVYILAGIVYNPVIPTTVFTIMSSIKKMNTLT